MLFRYFVVDLNDSTVLGTDSVATAEEFAGSEYYTVIDAKVGLWLQPEGADALPVEPIVEA